MDITVIVCTYNRCHSLAKALESIAASTLPEHVEWEILVVDNNSKDRTSEVCEDICRQFPRRFRYLFEARQGKSHALNTGIREAAGQVVAFMDDDVTVEPAWLRNIVEPIQNESYVGTGGRICPPKDTLLPSWIALEGDWSLAGTLALFDRGSVPYVLTDPPYGTNMAFRRDMFEKHGGFRTDLGPCAGSEIRGEDTEFCLRLMRSGQDILYVPTAIVYHEVPENRLRKSYFLTWYYDYGRAFIRMRGLRGDLWFIPRPVLGIMNHLFVMLPGAALRWWMTRNEKERFFAKTQVWKVMGQTAEIYHIWSTRKPLSEPMNPHALHEK